MRIRTVAGLAVAGAAAAGAIAAGVAYAAAEPGVDGEPIVRIVEQEAQPDKDCPDPSQAGL
ncbi:hypothetical protein [Actinophytocola gossypii]|uniref:Uncharacterized protein n=1 Tax=Actinophytocola gossypii TaxID=2812003 RepID=A0ABT2JJM8_9PSEU|nr:hypothetical protein [Actinophytocola gossypii]MCT2587719.1 hypothetical protein [Actinophytocola gossypii]